MEGEKEDEEEEDDDDEAGFGIDDIIEEMDDGGEGEDEFAFLPAPDLAVGISAETQDGRLLLVKLALGAGDKAS